MTKHPNIAVGVRRAPFRRHWSCEFMFFYSVLPSAVAVWLEYVQFSIGGMGEKDGIQQVRDVFEKALSAVGLHVSKGANIWEAYREFELAIMSGLQVSF